MPDKLRYLLASRKFWAAIVGLVIVLLGERAGIDAEELSYSVATIVAFIIGTALEDGLSRR